MKTPEEIQQHLDNAVDELRKTIHDIEDKETLELVYFAGRTIMTIKERLAPDPTTGTTL